MARVLEVTGDELLERLASGSDADLVDPDGVVVVLDPDERAPVAIGELVARVALLPAVVAGPPGLAAVADVVPESDADLEALLATVEACPLAATALAMLLRHSEGRSVADCLLAESAVYSTLQGGPEFAAWRAGRPSREPLAEGGPVVVCKRDGPRLEVRLNRPARRNAFSGRMRDELLDALAVAALDDSVAEVHLRGEGPSFCSGGDLDEFGTFPDPATAHLVRIGRSAGAAIHALTDRVVAHLHGACVGSGIELAAFAGRVVAAPDTTIALPEVSFGLVPGAGGTVSVPRRIGRHRTALLALARRDIDAPTALAWGLVDQLEEEEAAAAAAEGAAPA
jgi:enoyl-CoA hydratase/carnithine racemase